MSTNKVVFVVVICSLTLHYSCFDKSCPTLSSVKSYAIIPISIIGSDSLAFLDGR